MTQIGNVKEIREVKDTLENLKQNGLITEWEIPYENILTRLTAAIFFLTPVKEANIDEIWKALEKFSMLQYRRNEEANMSSLEWRVEFNKGFEL